MKRNQWLFGLVVALVLFFPSVSLASETVVWEGLGGSFTGYNGTFVLYDESRDQYIIYNEEQSQKRLSPCSTFKILQSLIGLDAGVISGDGRSLGKWDGTIHASPEWNHDQTLSTATRDSVDWYFDRVTSRIGTVRLQEQLDELEYGDRDLSSGERFWQMSSLHISAREQVDVLRYLFSGSAPFSEEYLAIVKRNIRVSNNGTATLMAKPGTGMRNGRAVLGWYVGIAEKDGQRWYFAANIEGDERASGLRASEISREILKKLDIL